MDNIIVYDLEVDEDGDLVFRNGDLSIVPSNDEHVKAVITSGQGDFKQYPQVGVNINKYLNYVSIPSDLKNIISKQLIADGNVIEFLELTKVDNKNININLNTKRSK